FHLDKVKYLGTFIEIEAIDRDGTIGNEKLRQQCEDYLREFDIKNSELIAISYSDMLNKLITTFHNSL
ncbi:MAG: adenylate cyclase, partial [bacterium]